MFKKNNILIFLMLLFFVMMVVSESRQKKINWFPSYSIRHKIPFGTYIAYHEAKNLWGKNLVSVNESPYVFFKQNKTKSGVYLIYNQEVTLGQTNVEALLDWVKNGNVLFISAEKIDQELLDSLQVESRMFFSNKWEKKLRFIHQLEKLKKDTAVNDKQTIGFFFRNKDLSSALSYDILGRFVDDKKEDSLYNFIRINVGKGTVFLHSVPYAFTNYSILKNEHNKRYFEGLLGYIGLKNRIYWDVHFQTGNKKSSIFEYILKNPAFLWAYRLAFVSLLLYVLFEGKRKQRPIPVKNPPKNETLTFTKTVADMYIQYGENKKIALIHIKHLMDYVRNKLHLDTRRWDKNLVKKIAEKTKTEEKTVKELFELIDEINVSTDIKPAVVVKLEELIEKVKETN